MLIDTHCHLDFPEFKDDLDDVLERSRQANVKYIINVSSSIEGARKSIELAQKYHSIFASVGIHPHHAEETDAQSLKEIEELLKGNKVAAIGEVGLDFYRNLSPKESQIKLFNFFLDLKEKAGLPIIIHSRDSGAETYDILKGRFKGKIDGVMHCFSQDTVYMKKILDMGLHISFTCNITFKNAAKLREAAKFAPLDRLLLETDAPFLAPQAFRGKRNEPAYLTYLVDAFSEIKGVPKEEVERVTTENAVRLFKLRIKN